jgi:Domain of unknown function (DUF4365)
MPNRPRQHVLEDIAHAALRRAVSKAGWTIEPLSKDYGEDFLVRIFHRGETTPFSFYVQSKATDAISKYLSKDLSTVYYPVETRHLVHWERFWEPVVLALYDAKSKRTYWRVIQPWLELQTDARKTRLAFAKTSRVSIPAGNLLNASGLSRLSSYTSHRFNRFKREQDGADHLVECLERAIGLKVEYDAQKGVLLIPNGSFQVGDGHPSLYLFGKCGAAFDKISKTLGKPADQTLTYVLRQALEAWESMSEQERKISRRNRDWEGNDA